MLAQATTRRVLAIMLAMILSGGATVQATAERAPSAKRFDLEAGKEVAETCVDCHGAQGISATPGTPHLAGQHAGYLLMALQAYADGSRAGANLEAMQHVAAELSSEDMANVAAYFGSLPPFTVVAPRNTEAAAAFDSGAEEDPFAEVKEATAGCAGCHGEDGNIELPGMPSLAGQSEAYLADTLYAYRDGSRKSDMMQPFAVPLSDSDIERMAFYYATLKPRRGAEPTTGDPFAGRAPSTACAGCHGEDGNGRDAGMPRLAGLDADYFVAAMNAYKDGSRQHRAMQEVVADLKETDIVNMSAFYATKQPKALPIRKPLTTLQWVEKCDRCHGPQGKSTDPRFPILAGQSESYLLEALTLYHGGQRGNSMMYAMSFPLHAADIKKLASYYARRSTD